MRIGLSIVLLACLLAGCERTVPAGGPFRVTRAFDADQMEDPPARRQFYRGDPIALWVDGYGGRTVTVHVYDDYGELVDSHTGYIPEGNVSYWRFEDLESGGYEAVLQYRGENREFIPFEVR